eukprot:CAMPEP_0202709322 /NCGR_PEP_ID=MMETSP1385-20130828/21462_1 /ASSEMBLY_ACC=CAM_ASM_000861 /TAXON_ID=933848 /ORGANISM="Elphidium margaritaceum" /LENGTH=251 /DNA_ID=CAMNT_0049368567 /DNA_START=26 /DNA_END=781 /DNA_ORIENTATION=-
MRKHTPGQSKARKVYAHCNPFNDVPYNFPTSPASMDWSQHFSQHTKDHPNVPLQVSFVDIGCGFGNLLLQLAKLWPNRCGVGMEIRQKAAEITRGRLEQLRKEYNDSHTDNQQLHHYRNVSVIRTNVMKYISHYFEKQSLDVMFFCFPDPHFKKSNHRRRIITTALLDYYAYLLKTNGLIYNITDVKDLYEWTVAQFEKHPLFERLTETELKDTNINRVVQLITNETDEAQRVTRNGGQKYVCVYRKKSIV